MPEHEPHLNHQYYQPHMEHFDHSLDHSQSHDHKPKEWNWSMEKEKHSTGKGSKNSTPLTALTLLAFFFFLNLLQSCIKDHMDAINPTAMVLTPQINRKRFTKAKTNPREESLLSAAESLDIESVNDEGEMEGNNGTGPYFIDDRIETSINDTRFITAKEESLRDEFHFGHFRPQYLNDSFAIRLKTPSIHHSSNLMPYLHPEHRSSPKERVYQKISSFQASFPTATVKQKVVAQVVNPTSITTQWAAVSLYTPHFNP